MYKFFGEPLKEIKSKESGKMLFRFDNKGEFITDDVMFIKRITGHFDHIELKVNTVGKRVEKIETAPVVNVVVVENIKEDAKND